MDVCARVCLSNQPVGCYFRQECHAINLHVASALSVSGRAPLCPSAANLTSSRGGNGRRLEGHRNQQTHCQVPLGSCSAAHFHFFWMRRSAEPLLELQVHTQLHLCATRARLSWQENGSVLFCFREDRTPVSYTSAQSQFSCKRRCVLNVSLQPIGD